MAAEPSRPACAPYPAQPGERTLSSGGDLDLGCVPQASVTTAGGTVVVWGLSEVPGASRLQAALALADAAARAELLASVQVGVASLLRSTGSTEVDGAAVLESVTAQVSRGLLPALPPPVHGWRKVQRGPTEVLIVAARISADKSAVRESVEASIWAAQRQQGGTRETAGETAGKVLQRFGAGRVLAPASSR
jgi:hypothetical protein